MRDTSCSLAGVETRYTSAFGHIDYFMTARHKNFVEKPIHDWAVEVFRH